MRQIAIDIKAPAAVEPGPAPMLQWIPIASLVVDDRYQRELKAENVRAIGRIAAAFKWSRFSPVLVAPVEGGRFAVIDGQHRTHAAFACGIEEVPCQVVQMDLKEQAASFAAVNGAVTKVTAMQIFRAAIAAGEAWAVEIRDVCERAGCRVLTSNRGDAVRKPGEVVTISYVRKLIERRGADMTATVLEIFRRSTGFGDDAANYGVATFRPVLEALASRPHLHASVPATIAVMERIDFDGLEADADTLIADRRRRGLPPMTKMDVMESMMGDALDKGLREAGSKAAA